MATLIIRQGSGLSRTDIQKLDMLDLSEGDLFLFLFPQMLPGQREDARSCSTYLSFPQRQSKMNA
jgi:hypothetical protein